MWCKIFMKWEIGLAIFSLIILWSPSVIFLVFLLAVDSMPTVQVSNMLYSYCPIFNFSFLFATKIPFWLLCICCLPFLLSTVLLTSEDCKWAYKWAPGNLVWWPFSPHPLQHLRGVKTLLTHLPCCGCVSPGPLSP